MQVRIEELSTHLQSTVRPVYLISGDETLRVEEACDAVLATARANGYTERSVHHVEGSYKWHELAHDGASLSLFAEKKVLDVRVPAKKFDREASDALRAWLSDNADSDETLLVLRTGRLEPRQRSSAWFKAIDKGGAIVLIWPLSTRELPRWLSQRMQQQGMQAESDALQYLCDKVEGNLLAAAQEIHKLSLQALKMPISLEVMAASLEDSSRFTSFDLLDAMMAGQPDRVMHILDVLRQEGIALFAILGAMTGQLRRLGDTQRLPPARKKIVQGFAQRIRDPLPVLAECAFIDQQGKGQKPGDPWISLEKMLLRLAGVRGVTLASRDFARSLN